MRETFSEFWENPEQEELRNSCAKGWAERVWNAALAAAPAQPEVQKLAKALEDIRKRSAINRAMNPNPFELTALLGDIYQIADSEP